MTLPHFCQEILLWSSLGLHYLSLQFDPIIERWADKSVISVYPVYNLIHWQFIKRIVWLSRPCTEIDRCCQVLLTPETSSCYLLWTSWPDTHLSFFLQRLDIRGRVKVLHGQNHKSDDPPLALFAVCTPFGPPSLLEMPQKDSMFKSKHKLDFSIVSMDSRGKQLLGYSEQDLLNRGGYDLVHYDDLAYVASAHQERKWTLTILFDLLFPIKCSLLKSLSKDQSSEKRAVNLVQLRDNNVFSCLPFVNLISSCFSVTILVLSSSCPDDKTNFHFFYSLFVVTGTVLKTGASGLIAYRLLIKETNKWQWLQTSARLQYKNSKPEHIMCTHRPLMEEEGRDLLGKRTMDFKVTYLDGGLSASNMTESRSSSTSLMNDSDFVMRCQRNRKYKSSSSGREVTQSCGSVGSASSIASGPTSRPSSAVKRKASSSNHSSLDMTSDPYSTAFSDPAVHAAAAAAYHPHASSMYYNHHHHPPSAVYTPYNHHTDSHNMNGLSSYAAAAAAMQPPNFLSHLFPGSSLKAATGHVDSSGRTENGSSATGLSHLFPSSSSLKSHDIARTPAENAAGLAAAMDHHHSSTRSFLAPDFLHYSRHALGTYYPEAYTHHPHSLHPHSQYTTNGLLESASYWHSWMRGDSDDSSLLSLSSSSSSWRETEFAEVQTTKRNSQVLRLKPPKPTTNTGS